MADFFTWLSDFFSFEIAMIGTTSVTLGLILAFSLIASLALRTFKRVGGR